jgi:lipid-A-disaccharide synthase-like uncharacterized protein
MEKFWLALGFLAQILFAARFVVQWVASERAKKSVVPLAFWILSMVGGGLLLMYAIWRKDPVFILGQCTGFLIYSRNLILIYKERTAMRNPADLDSPSDEPGSE